MTQRVLTLSILSLFMIAIGALSPQPVHAAEDAAPAAEEEAAPEQDVAKEETKEEPKEEAAAAAEEPTPEMEAVEKDPAVAKQEAQISDTYAEIEELTKGLSEREQQHFYLVYNNYNLIQTVQMVQGDVETAVKECGKNNPEMKEAMDERYAEWSAAINPVMDDADANVDKMVETQEYAPPKQIKKIMKALDKTRKETSKQIEKIPVTTPEACDYLRNKMSETQDSMLGLLKTTLVPFTQLFPEQSTAEDAVKEEPKEEKAKEDVKDEAKDDQKQEE